MWPFVAALGVHTAKNTKEQEHIGQYRVYGIGEHVELGPWGTGTGWARRLGLGARKGNWE